ncbi:hypothetical protein L1987_31556 [Smallanthus sonchifolius]|uniref:Uncharacterized protein n=1 Tax=Smallanthus sonchifolius TaxID=185202 RepID=A0ACB9I7Q0_9ASTR|nr:hypothetical protein L1987_31556 [Smallanthus sonchifolius]
METTVSWYNSGSLSRCWSRRATGYDELVTVTVSTSKARVIWRILLRKIKNAKKKMHRFSDPTRFGYEACEYAQNFDHGLLSYDSDDLSRSFSARFAVPNSAIFQRNGLID